MSSASVALLGDVAKFVRGITFKPDDVVPLETAGAVACMRTKNVQTTIDLEDVWGIPRELVKRDDQILRTGDLLVSTANSWNLVGKCTWVPELPWPATLGGFISALRADHDSLDPGYLYRWFSYDHTQALVRSCSRRTTNISNLSLDQCLALELPLPPIPQQRRIAAILDRADALRAHRRTALAELDTLTQSIFHDLFTGGLDGPAVDLSETRNGLPTDWKWQLLTDAARLATGHTPDREHDDYWNGDIPWISLTDIRDLDSTTASRTIQNVTQKGIDNSSSVLLPMGTVCFSRTASVGFVTVMGTEMATSQDFVNWVCGPRLDPTYLMWALIGARRRLKALSSGSTHKTIYMRVVEQFRVLVPPMSLQQEFARRVTAVEVLKSRHRAALAELDTLFASLQHRAFTGAL